MKKFISQAGKDLLVIIGNNSIFYYFCHYKTSSSQDKSMKNKLA
ncbi:hypothetical protein [Treponema phagedenis]|nr:hypothetical protein [Treponema phagedenis]EFW36463.1 hypothetical protein HMPREF9554_03078 [Treponema phagedenis F0421]